MNFLKRNKTAGKYISSGLLKTLAQTISGFIILRWIDPKDLGQWQSFTVFVGYIQILTLGTTSGLNRELPYWLGKGDKQLAMKRLKTAGYFITSLSFVLMFATILIAAIFYLADNLSLNNTIMLVFAFSTGALTIQTNFLGATYRSSKSFDKLSKIQLFNTLLYFVFLPLVYFFNIWGYIIYQVGLALALYAGYQVFKPFKVSYKFEKDQFKALVMIGFPIYFWNYIAGLSRTIPRLILVLFGNPLLVGLYSPAGSVNAAMLNLPNYTNRYLFPQMAYKFGKTGDAKQVYNYAIKASKILFIVMIIGASFFALIIPTIFTNFFPKYIDGILAAQITIFSGVFYSINALIHNALNSLKVYKPLKYIVILRLIYIAGFSYISFLIVDDLLLAVSIGAVLSEFFNLFNYLFFFKKVSHK
ncbi:lipopolysaccharide biosynthesis protein [Brumimicrobium oceani]|uniref:Polysaccharide biosynthesis protein C-terminal domain-containing protein n=1 Tax=Brumimicrobium oceani TaxID=2100725 RepID=A0A2U2XF33_9FLAO|nr:oligosaccharide flippase family protein [Brumimicrobium oceani]PWH86409.1 hypothetical protein DIT68_03995 [Brumimicrobium oceani]